MKRFPELIRHGAALALAAGMSLSVLTPGALAADVSDTHDHVHLAAENSVDELGNVDLSDEVYDVPQEDAEVFASEETEEKADDDADVPGGLALADPDDPEWLPEDMSYGSYDDLVAVQKHSHSKTIKITTEEATCTTPKRIKWKCYCTSNWWETVGGPLGHSYGDWITVEATCTTAGKRYRKCTRCGVEETDTSYAAENPPTGHSYGDWIVEDETCTKDAQKYRVCENIANGVVCGDVEHDTEYEETHPAHGHDLQYEDSWEFPCVEGTRTWFCANEDCDGIDIPAPETLEPTAEHTYGDWVVTKEPTCTGYGERQRTCTVCGSVETDTTEGKEIQPIGHDWGEWVDDDKPACQQQTATRRCKRDGCNATEQKNLPNFGENGNPKPHKYTRWDTKGDLKDGWIPVEITYSYCDYCGHKEERENNASLTTNTQAAKVAADELKGTVRKIVFDALKDVQTNVNAAQTKEEATTAIANLKDSLAKAMAEKITMKVGGYTVGLTEKQAKDILDSAMPELDNIKSTLDDSFLSKESIQAAVNKIVDSVTGSEGEKATEDAAYELLYKLAYDQLAGGTSDYAEPVKILVGKLASILAADDTGWDALTEAIVNDAIELGMEELRKDEDYKDYVDTQLGADALDAVAQMIREQLVQDPSFMNEVRGYVKNAASRAANGAAKGWSNEKLLTNLRTDLMPVSSLVAKKITELGVGAGDIADGKVDDTVHKFLPGIIGDWVSDWLGGMAQDKTTNAIDKAGAKVANLIVSYLKYITCPSHNHDTRIAQNASCTDDEYTEDYCTECDWVFKRYKTGDAWGHTPVTVAATAPTQTTDGLTEGVQCAVCGYWIEPQEVIPALTPEYDKWLVQADVTADTVKATGYKDQKALDAAIDAALTKAGFTAADSERFLAQAQTNLDVLKDEYDREPGEGASRILPNDRYPEDGITGMVKIPAKAAGKNCTYYAVQVLTADSHGYSAGDVVVTPLTVTKEGISLKLPVQSVVAIAWKVNE